MKLPSNPTLLRSERAGMTLVEMMIAVMIASIVFAAVGSLAMFTSRSFVAMGNYTDLDRVSCNALDQMSRDIRQTRGLKGYSPTKLTFNDYDNTPLVFEFHANKNTLTRKKAGITTTLLTECDMLSFNIAQRNPSNDFTFYTVSSNLATAKLIDVNWRCSRKILGNKVNTESVQTAKIVLRN